LNSETFWTGMPGILTALGGLIAPIGTLIGVLHSAGLLKKKTSAAEADAPSDDDRPSAEAGKPAQSAGMSHAAAAQVRLRSAPAIVSGEKMSAMLVKRGFFDRRRNPAGGVSDARYDTKVDGQMLMIIDSSTGLTWEMGGSDQPMRFEEASERVDQLNSARAGGYADWRLPTAEEAMSLLRSEAADGLHLSNQFRRGVNFIWTADLVDDGGRAWVVYFADGTIEAEPKDFNAWVRAVR
jgi:hypothetical protein